MKQRNLFTQAINHISANASKCCKPFATQGQIALLSQTFCQFSCPVKGITFFRI